MNWQDWMPVYEEILDDFSFDRASERRAIDAARQAAALYCPDPGASLELLGKLTGKEVVVAGNSAKLETDFRALSRAGIIGGKTIMSADGASTRLERLGVRSGVIVTDMDGSADDEIRQNGRGSMLLLHFHGDNYRRAHSIASRLRGPCLITVQGEPGGGTFNFGGFTDGDRAVLTAESLGAGTVYLAGFDFDHPKEKGKAAALKIRKLAWAKRIIDGASARGMKIKFASEYGGTAHVYSEE
ncbi:MAG: DUF115 domain-containing protein [Candidatus Thermoplasmatota archaeon]|nr:DUF115 domain-containing protein [Candidatus Thermoplasmatota archaeon]